MPTEEKRSVESPENETEGKGARDSFVESVRTSTSLVRRRLKSAQVKISGTVGGPDLQHGGGCALGGGVPTRRWCARWRNGSGP